MKTKEMTVTPEQAGKWLALNTRNRPLRQGHVDYLAAEIVNGRWQLTHQGIALNGTTLIDGQHRLAAIVQANRAVMCLVTTDADITMQDVIDGGAKRTVSDQLHLSDGVANANLTAAACRCIAELCVGSKIKLSLGLARGIIAEVGREMGIVTGVIDGFAPGRRGWVAGSLTFALYADGNAREFIDGFFSGENLTKGSPAKAAREWLINRSSYILQGNEDQPRREALLNAVKNSIVGIPITTIKSGESGAEYFLAKRRKFVSQLRAELQQMIA